MTGIERFMAGLARLGFKPEQRGSLVVVELDVTVAARADLREVGADPPEDFPNIPPHWLHLRKELALSEGKGKASELGKDWKKWSRKHPSWKGGEHAAREWLAHARSLFLASELA